MLRNFYGTVAELDWDSVIKNFAALTRIIISKKRPKWRFFDNKEKVAWAWVKIKLNVVKLK